MNENENFNEAMKVFVERYQPAGSAAESDDELTTTEIRDKLTELIDEASLEAIYEYMKESGFHYQMIGGRFKWLLKKS